jgi:hypothetical protein
MQSVGIIQSKLHDKKTLIGLTFNNLMHKAKRQTNQTLIYLLRVACYN